MMTEDHIESIKAAAESIFETITVYKAEPKDIDGGLNEIVGDTTKVDFF